MTADRLADVIRGLAGEPGAAEPLLRLEHGSAIHSVAYGPAGRRLATLDHDGHAQLWDAETGTRIAQLDPQDAGRSATQGASGDLDKWFSQSDEHRDKAIC